MSNSSRNKVSQNDLRRLMALHKNKVPTPKIDNPLAKYNDAGLLTCVLCKSIVRSEAVWQVHVNSRQHKDNVAEAKRLKEQTDNFTKVSKAPKRPATPPPVVTEAKKIKGILKNAPSKSVPDDFFQKPKPQNVQNCPYVLSHNEEIKRAPLKQFPAKAKVKEESQHSESISEENKQDDSMQTSDQPIPEGFFDDPILDAKARNIEYKDPVEEEWERFQKEMKEEASVSAELIAGEQEEATAERQIDEIDEQMRNWSRVLDLELKKEETSKTKAEPSDSRMDEDSSASDTDVDEFLDWRAKRSFR